MTAVFWWGIALLAAIGVGSALLVCSAHIPGLREVTDAPPLESEPESYTHTTEQDTTFLLGDYTPATADRNVRSIAAERARRAAHVSQLPHGSARRGTHL